MEEDCLKETRCPNCWQDHLAYSRSCDIYKKDKEILEVKQKKEYNLPESKENSRVIHGRKHISFAWRVDPINEDNKSRALIEEVTNKEKSNEVVLGKTYTESTIQTWTTPPKSAKSPPTNQLLHKSPIHPPKTIKDR